MSPFRLRALAVTAVLSAVGWAGAEEPLARPLPTRTAAKILHQEGGCLVVRFSSDGKTLAVATRDSLKLHDAATLRESPVKLDAAVPDAGALAFSTDGRWLAAGGAVVRKVDKEYKRFVRMWVWDTATGKRVAELEGGTGDCNAVTFSADGKLLATGESDGTVRLWDTATKKEKLAIPNPGSAVRAVTFSKDAKLAIHGGANGAIRLTDTTTGREVAALAGHDGGVLHLVLPADGNTLISTGADGVVRVWDLARRKELRAFRVAAQTVAVVSGPDGKPVAVPGAVVNDLSVTADGALVSVGLFRTVKIFDTGTEKQLAELVGHTGQLRTASFAPDGKTLASGDNFDTRLWAIAIKTEGVRVFDTGARVYQFALTPDGRTFATGGGDDVVRVWDATTGTISRKIERTATDSLALSPDGKTLVAGVRIGGPLQEYGLGVWDARTGSVIRVTGNRASPLHRLALSPSGAELATADRAGTVMLREVKTGGLIDKLVGQTGEASWLAFSADGKRLATTAVVSVRKQVAGGSLVVWGTDDGLRVATAIDKDHVLAQPVFASDGKTVLVCGRGTGGKRVLLVYDALTGAKKERIELPDHVDAFAASADGKWLALGEGTDVHLWDRKANRTVVVLRGHSGEIGHLAFTADGAKLFSTGSTDRTVREWDVRTVSGVKP